MLANICGMNPLKTKLKNKFSFLNIDLMYVSLELFVY
jgi:hypothetical protein